MFLVLLTGGAAVARTWESAKSAARPGNTAESTDLPLCFEPNQGQTDEPVRFVARGPGYGLYFTPRSVLFRFSRTLDVAQPAAPKYSIDLVGVREDSWPEGLDELPSKTSYYMGSDPKKWLTGIPNFARVRLANAYPGIDVLYRGLQGMLEYEFQLAPQALPSAIALEVAGTRDLRLNARGELLFTFGRTAMRMEKPVAFQDRNGSREPVPARYRLKGSRIVFEIGHYDRSRPLRIAPVLRYDGYLRLQEADAEGEGREIFAPAKSRPTRSAEGSGDTPADLSVPPSPATLSKQRCGEARDLPAATPGPEIFGSYLDAGAGNEARRLARPPDFIGGSSSCNTVPTFLHF